MQKLPSDATLSELTNLVSVFRRQLSAADAAIADCLARPIADQVAEGAARYPDAPDGFAARELLLSEMQSIRTQAAIWSRAAEAEAAAIKQAVERVSRYVETLRLPDRLQNTAKRLVFEALDIHDRARLREDCDASGKIIVWAAHVLTDKDRASTARLSEKYLALAHRGGPQAAAHHALGLCLSEVASSQPSHPFIVSRAASAHLAKISARNGNGEGAEYWRKLTPANHKPVQHAKRYTVDALWRIQEWIAAETRPNRPITRSSKAFDRTVAEFYSTCLPDAELPSAKIIRGNYKRTS